MKSVLVLGLAGVLAGCASAPKSSFAPVPAQLADQLARGPVSVEVKPAPGFVHSTRADAAIASSGVMFGAIGGALGQIAAIANAKRRGGATAQSAGLVDPSLRSAEKLRRALGASPVADAASAARLQLNTSSWSITPTHLFFYSDLQLLGVGSSKPHGQCRYSRTYAEMASDPEALLASGGAGLKAQLDLAADHCADYFLQHLKPTAATPAAAGSGSRTR